MNLEKRKQHLEIFLHQKISSIEPKARGMCNDIFFVETETGQKYLIKEERTDKETEEQNSLIVESRLLQRLNVLDPSLPIPRIVFSSENPVMFGYELIDGEMLGSAWSTLPEASKTDIFQGLGNFHAQLGRLIDKETARDIGIRIEEENIDLADLESYEDFLRDPSIPEDWKALAKRAKAILEETKDSAIVQCIHNDLHDKNIIIHRGYLVGVVDFGDTEFSDVHKDFCYHVRRYPENFREIIDSFQQVSGQTISIPRAVAYAAYSDLKKLANHFHNPDVERKFVIDGYGATAKERINNYSHLLSRD